MPDSSLSVVLLTGRFEVRGSSAYTLRLADHLMDYAVATSIVCSDASSVERSRRKALFIHEHSFLGLPIWGRLTAELLRRDFTEGVPDLIHIQSRRMLSQGTWLARRLQRPFVLTMHDFLQPRERFHFDRTWGRRIITVSESVKDELLRRTHIPADLVTVIHSGVEYRDDISSPPVLEAGRVAVVGTAGPLESVKGLPFFLGAAQKVLAQKADVEFLIAGAGPEEANLRRLTRDLGIGAQVTFVPNLFSFSTSLNAMDIFCLTSLKQGLGTIMLEAMALGKPVIASAVGGVYRVVRDNQTGLTIPPSDSTRLAERILELLNDPVRARTIGEAARRMVRSEFGVQQMVAHTAEVYRQSIDATSPAGIVAVAVS